MDDIAAAQVGDWIGKTVIDPDGDKIGKVKDVYLDDDTGQPEWLAITTGLFGTKVSFAPLPGAAMQGDDLLLPYTKAQVKDAPRCDADGHLSPEEEESLYSHYGLTYGGMTPRADETGDLTTRSMTTEGMTTGTTASRSTTGGMTTGGMASERLGGDDVEGAGSFEGSDRFDDERAEAGKGRLRRWVGTEHGETMRGPETSDVEDEVTIYEDEVVMSDADTGDRVLLETEVVEEEQRMPVEGDTGRGTRT